MSNLPPDLTPVILMLTVDGGPPLRISIDPAQSAEANLLAAGLTPEQAARYAPSVRAAAVTTSPKSFPSLPVMPPADDKK